jgi:transposase-like protein
MSQKRRIFSDEFKAKVLAEVSSGKSMAEVTRQYSLAKNAVYDWRNQAAAGSDSVTLPKRELSALESKIASLERLVGRLSVENDFLKKLEKLESVDRSEPS